MASPKTQRKRSSKMANPYAALFQVPGARAFVLAGMLARMPVSMTGIGLITMLAQVHGGYGTTGSAGGGGGWTTWGCGSFFTSSSAVSGVRLVSGVGKYATQPTPS